MGLSSEGACWRMMLILGFAKPESLKNDESQQLMRAKLCDIRILEKTEGQLSGPKEGCADKGFL